MMRHLFYKLLVGVAAFLIGLSMVSIRHASRPMSLCELDANPSAYAGKTVRFRAILERRRSVGLEKEYLVFGYSFCENSNEVANVSIELDESEAAKIPLTDAPTRSSGEANHFQLTDAVIEGQLDPYFQLGCFGPKYNISNARVERVFSTQNFEDFPPANEWIKSNSY